MWKERSSKSVWKDERDWKKVLEIGREFVRRFELPQVVNLGLDAQWIDTGRCSELYSLYQHTVSRSDQQRQIFRSIFGLSPIPSLSLSLSPLSFLHSKH